MARWTLYTARGTCALATHIALLEAGADFDVVALDFSKTEQQSLAYLAVNPKGRVPSLRTPQGVLTETPALLLFVARSFPAAALAPFDDVFAFARMEELPPPRCTWRTLTVAAAPAGPTMPPPTSPCARKCRRTWPPARACWKRS
jgi:glutathione S-transferase